jgi:nucleotide-binding universal stress UspA family protein
MQALQTGTRLCLRSILFATDFSAYSERAFPFAFRLAQRYGATVHVAHVIAPESPSGKTMDRAQAEDSRDLREARTSLAEFLASAPAGSATAADCCSKAILPKRSPTWSRSRRPAS